MSAAPSHGTRLAFSGGCRCRACRLWFAHMAVAGLQRDHACAILGDGTMRIIKLPTCGPGATEHFRHELDVL